MPLCLKYSDYNGHIGYVELADRMTNTYLIDRGHKMWTNKIFFQLLNVATLNS